MIQHSISLYFKSTGASSAVEHTKCYLLVCVTVHSQLPKAELIVQRFVSNVFIFATTIGRFCAIQRATRNFRWIPTPE